MTPRPAATKVPMQQETDTATEHTIRPEKRRRIALKPNPEYLQTIGATKDEPAMQPQRSTATEHAREVARRTPPRASKQHTMQAERGTAREHAMQPRTTLKATTDPELGEASETAQTDRGDETMANLTLKLTEFLSTLLREVWHTPKLFEDIIFETIAEWDEQSQGRHYYGEKDLLMHKKMWDVMTQKKDDKQYCERQYSYSEWCRRIAKHRNTSSTAREHAATDSTATEHTESHSFRALANDILTNDLTPEQARRREYRVCEGQGPTTKACCLINAILQKNLGDSRVTNFIFNHGLPTVMDLARLQKKKQIEVLDKENPTRAQLEHMLHDLMAWHASLLQSLVDRTEEPAMTATRMLSDVRASGSATEQSLPVQVLP